MKATSNIESAGSNQQTSALPCTPTDRYHHRKHSNHWSKILLCSEIEDIKDEGEFPPLFPENYTMWRNREDAERSYREDIFNRK